jgi:hypothetical protein
LRSFPVSFCDCESSSHASIIEERKACAAKLWYVLPFTVWAVCVLILGFFEQLSGFQQFRRGLVEGTVHDLESAARTSRDQLGELLRAFEADCTTTPGHSRALSQLGRSISFRTWHVGPKWISPHCLQRSCL